MISVKDPCGEISATIGRNLIHAVSGWLRNNNKRPIIASDLWNFFIFSSSPHTIDEKLQNHTVCCCHCCDVNYGAIHHLMLTKNTYLFSASEWTKKTKLCVSGTCVIFARRVCKRWKCVSYMHKVINHSSRHGIFFIFPFANFINCQFWVCVECMWVAGTSSPLVTNEHTMRC